MRYTIIFFLATIFTAQGQTENAPQNSPNSLTPSTPVMRETKTAPRSTRRSVKKTSHIETHDEFVARMKRTAKEIRKNERLMKKPQYSDPLYFGHKRPPKKHKAGKLKFCKECGIRH